MAHPKIPGKYSCNINVPKDGDIQLAWMESRGGGGGGCFPEFNNLHIHIQQQYLFNSNPIYFHSTRIFVQLQPKIISFNENNYSTSTKNNFIQRK